MTTIRSTFLLACMALFLGASPGFSQTPSVVGQWQCSYGTRNVHNSNVPAVYFEFAVSVHQNGGFQAQGVDHSGQFQFQAQGQWALNRDSDGLWFVLQGRRTHPLAGQTNFVIHTLVRNASLMSMNYQDRSGMAVVSQCQRTG